MIRLLVYLLILGIVLYVLWAWGKGGTRTPQIPGDMKRSRFRTKRDPWEVWLQVYETDSLEEARLFQAKLQEQELECVLYEQGKKDIHGNPLKGIGIAVPKTSSRLAQNIISRTP